MNVEEYTQAAFRTATPGARDNVKEDIHDQFSPLCVQLTSCGLGLVGEASEVIETVFFSSEHFEEIGDCLWYGNVLFELMTLLMEFEDDEDRVIYVLEKSNTIVEELSKGYNERDMYAPLIIAAKISEQIKKIVIHGKVDDERLIRLYAYTAFFLCLIWPPKFLESEGRELSSFGVPFRGKQGKFPTMGQVMFENIEKLKARYP